MSGNFRKMIAVRGAADIHVHSHPCLFPRVADDRETVLKAKEAGLAAILLKCHHESSVSRAYLLDREFGSEIRVFGGIVLNRYVGGLNPAAVEAALRMGGKEVWMPTIDAHYHGVVHGRTGAYDVQSGGRQSQGITVLADGKIKGDVLEIMDLIAQHDVILGTCHLSPEEILALVKEARRRSVKKVLITHPFFKVPNLELPFIKKLVKLGAVAEFGYCTVSPMWNYASMAKVKDAIKELSAENCVIMSDSGQRHNPISPESLRVFAQGLYEKGLTDSELEIMMIKNPKSLLDL